MRASQEFRKQIITYVLGGFGLVAGLAWNDAIKSLIEYLYPLQQNGLLPKFVYAAIITIILVIVSLGLTRFNQPPQEPK